MAERVVYLNLQEQVGKNKKDIEELKKINYNLERFGVRVVGEEANVEDLPDPSTYGGDLGDAYLIGTEPPYDMYIYTQPSAGETDFKWFNIGPFPAPGAQGPQGPEGPEGPEGKSTKWRVGQTNPSILSTDEENDCYLNTTTGMVYQFNGSNWVPTASIRGPQGDQGVQGLQGETGPRGPIGPIGPIGPAGSVVEVVAVVNTLGSLPDPDTVPRNAAYVLDDGVNKDLYIIVESDGDLIWYNAGPFTGVAGDAAGFGTVSASLTPLGPDDTPTAAVSTSGPNTAKNMAFTFGIPVGIDLSNQNNLSPSTTKGYTQKVINDRSMNRVIKSYEGMGFTSADLPIKMADIMSWIGNNDYMTDILLVNKPGETRVIDDSPTTYGQLHIRSGGGNATPEVKWIDMAYNVYLYGGQDASVPPASIWNKITTTADGGGGGGGVTIIGENILINPMIGSSPINQRGYTSSKTTVNANTYTIDRWMAKPATTLACGSPLNLYGGTLHQYIDKLQSWGNGSKYFFAGVKINKSGSALTPTIRLGYKPSGSLTYLTPVNANPIVVDDGNIRQIVNIYENPGVVADYYDFEIGVTAAQSTDCAALISAFLYTGPTYDESALSEFLFPVVVDQKSELEKSKYYYYEMNANGSVIYIGAIASQTDSGSKLHYTIFNKMRITPTCSTDQYIQLIAASSAGRDLIYSSLTRSGEIIDLMFTSSDNNYGASGLRLVGNAAIKLNAEIYPS